MKFARNIDSMIISAELEKSIQSIEKHGTLGFEKFSLYGFCEHSRSHIFPQSSFNLLTTFVHMTFLSSSNMVPAHSKTLRPGGRDVLK